MAANDKPVSNPFSDLLAKRGEHKLKAIIFGPSGIGKTRFLASAGLDKRTSPILVLDFEGGSLSLEGAPDSVDVIPVSSPAVLNDVFRKLSEPHPYKSIAFDSLTETHIDLLFSLPQRENRRDQNRIELGDYGIASVSTRRLIRALRDLDLHVFFTALEKQEIDSLRGLVSRVNLPGKLSIEVPAIVDVVGYLSRSTPEGKDEPQRVLVLQNYSSIDSKARSPIDVVVPDELWEPTVAKLLDALHI